MERVALALASTAGERHEVIEVPLLDVTAAVELFCGHSDSGEMDPSSADNCHGRRLFTTCDFPCRLVHEGLSQQFG
jgi:hypothetical protein